MGNGWSVGQLVWAGIMFLCGFAGLFISQADSIDEEKNKVPKVWVFVAFGLGIALLLPIAWDAFTGGSNAQLAFPPNPPEWP